MLMRVYQHRKGAVMNSKLKTPAVEQLFDAILSLENKEECAAFFEIAFERGQAAAGIIGDLFHRYIVHVITFEEFQYVDFPRVRKVEDRSIQVLARIKQHIYALDHFQLQ